MVSPVENDYRAFVTGQSSDEEAVRQIDQLNFPNRKRLSNTLTVIDTKTYGGRRNICCGLRTSGNGDHAGWKEGLRGQRRNPAFTENDFELIPSNSVSIVDTETKEVKTIEIGNFPTYMVMTPDGRKVYVTHSDITSAAPGNFSFGDRC
jgi:DNA-binding beta-propeller fold protein YncE